MLITFERQNLLVWVPSTLLPNSKISPSTRSSFKSNSPVLMHRMISGFTLENVGLHVLSPYWFIVLQETGQDFATSSDSEISGFTVNMLSDFLRIYFFFHCGERIQKYPDSSPNSPDARGYVWTGP